MLAKNKIETGKSIEMEEANGGPAQAANDKGFSDLTDLKNEDFVFVY